ncbi:hypothetical protein, partial [Roseinatronobacter sp.]|uniref:hypothetical protein n=1 Tax=Roseinatronobacter sp. TaxID=1945755 RepID=UPI0026007121
VLDHRTSLRQAVPMARLPFRAEFFTIKMGKGAAPPSVKATGVQSARALALAGFGRFINGASSPPSASVFWSSPLF